MNTLTPLLSQWLARFDSFYRRWRGALLWLGLLALFAYVLERFFWATGTHGIGVRTDSVEYLWTAKNLAAGLGLSRLTGSGELKAVTHWPPFYPMVLSLFELAGVPALTGARWLGAALTGLIVLFTGLTVARVTRSVWLALLAALLLSQAPSLWITSLDAMTEPLYVALGMGGALLLDTWLARSGPARPRWVFALSALCMGAGLLTRYVGITQVAAGALVLLLYPRAGESRPRRWAGWLAGLKEAVVFGLIGIAPMIAWMVYNELRSGSATNRYLNLIPIPASDYELLRETLFGWYAPALTVLNIGAGKLALIAAALVVIAGLEILRRRNLMPKRADVAAPPADAPTPPAVSPLVLFYAIYAVLYPLMVYFSRLLFDSLITIFEERIAFPWFVTLLLLIFFALRPALGRLSTQRGWQRAARYALVLVLLVAAYTFGRSYHQGQVRVLERTRADGRGLNTPGWQNAGITQTARALTGSPIIYSDNLEVLYFISGRASFQVNEMTEATLRNIQMGSGGRDVVFVFFYSRNYTDLARAFYPHAQVLYSGGDGDILLVSP